MDEPRKGALTSAQSALLDKYRYLLEYGFHGSYVHGLDSKGRLIVPAAFREALGGKVLYSFDAGSESHCPLFGHGVGTVLL